MENFPRVARIYFSNVKNTLDLVKMFDRSGAMSFMLKNGNDVTSFDRTQPKGGKIFHRGLVKFLVVLDASIEGTKSRKQEERKEERRRFLEDVSWHQRFAVPRYIENIKPRFPFFFFFFFFFFFP